MTFWRGKTFWFIVVLAVVLVTAAVEWLPLNATQDELKSAQEEKAQAIATAQASRNKAIAAQNEANVLATQVADLQARLQESRPAEVK